MTAASAPRRVAILVSGRGSNMAALIAAARVPGYPAKIARIISSRPDAPALLRAREAGVPAVAVDHKVFGSDRGAFENDLSKHLEDVDIICLAGFMRIFTPGFIAEWQGRMLNIHPSLLPDFPGLHPHRQALAAGVKETGCSVHFVTNDLDAGPIVAQARVPVLPGDTEAALAARVLEKEHVIYPLALRLLAGGHVRLDDETVIFGEAAREELAALDASVT